jgi:hypothetical protein
MLDGDGYQIKNGYYAGTWARGRGGGKPAGKPEGCDSHNQLSAADCAVALVVPTVHMSAAVVGVLAAQA